MQNGDRERRDEGECEMKGSCRRDLAGTDVIEKRKVKGKEVKEELAEGKSDERR